MEAAFRPHAPFTLIRPAACVSSNYPKYAQNALDPKGNPLIGTKGIPYATPIIREAAMAGGGIITIRTRILVFVQAILVAACGESPLLGNGSESPPSRMESARVKALIKVDRVGVLCKPAAGDLRRLIVTAVSDATPSDTVRDTLGMQADGGALIHHEFTLKPLRHWSFSAHTRDEKDSAIHTGSAEAFYLRPADSAEVEVDLKSRFSIYQANFKEIPDSVTLVTSIRKVRVDLKRFVLKIDGTVVADSISGSSFPPGTTVSLRYDYVRVGTHSATLEAHGEMTGYSGLMYSGSRTLEAASGTDHSEDVKMTWQAPVPIGL